MDRIIKSLQPITRYRDIYQAQRESLTRIHICPQLCRESGCQASTPSFTSTHPFVARHILMHCSIPVRSTKKVQPDIMARPKKAREPIVRSDDFSKHEQVPRTPLGLLERLPPEVRHLVYGQYFMFSSPASMSTDNQKRRKANKHSVALLRTSKIINQECEAALAMHWRRMSITFRPMTDRSQPSWPLALNQYKLASAMLSVPPTRSDVRLHHLKYFAKTQSLVGTISFPENLLRD